MLSLKETEWKIDQISGYPDEETIPHSSSTQAFSELVNESSIWPHESAVDGGSGGGAPRQLPTLSCKPPEFCLPLRRKAGAVQRGRTLTASTSRRPQSIRLWKGAMRSTLTAFTTLLCPAFKAEWQQSKTSSFLSEVWWRFRNRVCSGIALGADPKQTIGWVSHT